MPWCVTPPELSAPGLWSTVVPVTQKTARSLPFPREHLSQLWGRVSKSLFFWPVACPYPQSTQGFLISQGAAVALAALPSKRGRTPSFLTRVLLTKISCSSLSASLFLSPFGQVTGVWVPCYRHQTIDFMNTTIYYC